MNIQEWRQRIKSAKFSSENDLRLLHSEFLKAWAVWLNARRSASEYVFQAQLAETKQINADLQLLENEIMQLFKTN